MRSVLIVFVLIAVVATAVIVWKGSGPLTASQYDQSRPATGKEGTVSVVDPKK
jgi:hypothetical protein